jgi:hypothetical protein
LIIYVLSIITFRIFIILYKWYLTIAGVKSVANAGVDASEVLVNAELDASEAVVDAKVDASEVVVDASEVVVDASEVIVDASVLAVQEDYVVKLIQNAR